MPSVPKATKCSHLGCPNTRSKLNTFCLEHGGLQHTNHGKENQYGNPAWRTIRRAQLSKQPLCQSCLINGQIVSANHVDHVFPWRQIGEHSFLHNIFQSLCHECHSYKTGQERKGVYYHFSTQGTQALTQADYNAHMGQWNKNAQ
jgi:5-methylcytosine-specific restriction protein A